MVQLQADGRARREIGDAGRDGGLAHIRTGGQIQVPRQVQPQKSE